MKREIETPRHLRTITQQLAPECFHADAQTRALQNTPGDSPHIAAELLSDRVFVGRGESVTASQRCCIRPLREISHLAQERQQVSGLLLQLAVIERRRGEARHIVDVVLIDTRHRHRKVQDRRQQHHAV